MAARGYYDRGGLIIEEDDQKGLGVWNLCKNNGTFENRVVEKAFLSNCKSRSFILFVFKNCDFFWKVKNY